MYSYLKLMARRLELKRLPVVVREGHRETGDREISHATMRSNGS
jgi:hypothetical protein